MEPKLCKDCKHYVASSAMVFDKCAHPQVSQPDLVRGDTTSVYCSVLRIAQGICGHEGKLFDSKEVANAAT